MRRTLPPVLSLASVLALSACVGQPGPLDVVPHDAGPETMALAQIADDLERLSQDRAARAGGEAVPVQIIGRGFGQVAGQPGGTANERRLMAIRAARMEALRDLTEQVHGVQISSSSTLRDASMTNDTINALVEGEIRGARTLSITPRDADSFEVVMALDPDTVRYILRAARRGL
ncbi:LPP20 family lipoprotein [Roseicyclus mahoneyensis]|uniref:Lipoprotein LPP20-like domain-containing protein n=1 Tax=Roseicyclus mahoneyensis TaxID=164332 RepID=A0A316GZ08_9RHOB|nr:LPP20 family lipoprotein [Roseicyclus mahoneyensis]PWK60369.1 hypothetical protein C7455_1045 [Roseicyclus mahoneyensis]